MRNILAFAILVAAVISCGGDDSPPDLTAKALDACGNLTTETVNDKRCLYTVSTLTQSFNGSGGLSVSTDGFIYVADFGDNLSNANGTTVSKVDPQARTVSVFATGLNGASGNTFSENGNLIQANIRGQSVSEITPDGVVTNYSDVGFASPVGVTFDGNGDLFVCNCSGKSIQKVESDGTSSVFVSDGLLDCPNGLTIDDAGNLYAANFNNSNVVRVKPDGTAELFVQLPGSSNSHLTFGNGVLYVLSRGGNKLYEVTLNGEISVIAGAGSSGNADGTGELATFTIPNGIDVSPDGKKIYITSKVTGQGSQLNPVLVRVIELK